MRVIDVSAPSTVKFVRALVLGGPKAGKTHFAATCPAPLFISDVAEGGFETLTGMDPALWWDEKVKPEVWAIENAFADMPGMLGNLEKLKATNNFPFRTIVIDPVSIYADRVIAELEMRASESMAKTGKSVDRRALYGDLLLHMRVQLMRFHALPANIIWLCHIKDGGIAIPGQTADKFPAYMDFTWLCTNTPSSEGNNFLLQTQPTGAFSMLGERSKIAGADGKRYGLPSPMIPSFKCVAQILKLGVPPSPAIPGYPQGLTYAWPPLPEPSTDGKETV